jgi:CBS domain-containing protein
MSDTAAIPASLLNATIDHLTRFAPFSEMRRADLEWMVERLSLAYTPKGSIVLDPAQGLVRQFHVIKQGSVVSERLERGAAAAEAHTQLVAGEDTFCYQLAAEHFTELLRRSHPFQDFCTRRIAHLLERWLMPRLVVDAHIPFVTFFVLVWLWFLLIYAKYQLCLAHGLNCTR